MKWASMDEAKAFRRPGRGFAFEKPFQMYYQSREAAVPKRGFAATPQSFEGKLQTSTLACNKIFLLFMEYISQKQGQPFKGDLVFNAHLFLCLPSSLGMIVAWVGTGAGQTYRLSACSFTSSLKVIRLSHALAKLCRYNPLLTSSNASKNIPIIVQHETLASPLDHKSAKCGS